MIAEIGLNHDGIRRRALALVDAAAARRRVRRQAAVAARRTLVAPIAPARRTLAHVDGASLRDFFARYELDEAAHARVAARARAHGLALLSSPFDEAAVDMLDRLDVDASRSPAATSRITG